MIELITGLPGNGKTLYTISQVRKRAQDENRQVYYHGIPELTLDWVLLEDPREWAKCPPNSIVVLDEAQKIFRARSMGAQPPEYVAQLETHRHLGIDLVFITQHPALIDPSVRRLAGRHQHLVRVHGFAASTVHRWESVKDNCDKPTARKDSEKKKWNFDKSVYSLYKSAEVHTVKPSIPGRVKLLAVLFVLFVAMAWYFGMFLKKKTTAPEKSAEVVTASSGKATQSPAGGFYSEAGATRSPPPDPVADVEQYVFRETPRLAGLPHTAPKYDGITVPVRAPVPAMCVQIQRQGGRLDCRCYTQQATRMQDMEVNMCLDFVHNRRFQDFDAEPGRVREQQQVERPPAAAPREPNLPSTDSYRSSPVMAFADVPSQMEGARPPPNLNDGPPPGRTTRTEVVRQ